MFYIFSSRSYIPVFNYVPNDLAPYATYGSALKKIVHIVEKHKLNSEKEVINNLSINKYKYR